MSPLNPIYSHANCQPAYQLTWSLSLFWKSPPPRENVWLGSLADATESDGVRILEHRQASAKTSLFLVSTRPHSAPAAIIRSVKGRLQYLVRHQLPSAFHRNYSVISVGKQQASVVENYVSKQIGHHPLADARLEERFRQYQFSNLSVDLSRIRRSFHGEFCYSLHLVFEYGDGWRELRHDVLLRTRDMLERSSIAKGWLLSRVGIVPDHLHLAVGCGITDAPDDVAMSYLNNLAFVHGMMPKFKFSYYAGTIGPYDLGAIWNRQPQREGHVCP